MPAFDVLIRGHNSDRQQGVEGDQPRQTNKCRLHDITGLPVHRSVLWPRQLAGSPYDHPAIQT